MMAEITKFKKEILVNELYQKAKIYFYNQNDKLIKTETYQFIDSEHFNKILNQEKTINLDYCFVEIPSDFFIEADKAMRLPQLSAQNSFFTSTDDYLNISNVFFDGDENLFSGTIFFAKKIDFSGCYFNSKHTCFEHTKFFCNQISFNNTKFNEGIVSFKNAFFSESLKNFQNIDFGKAEVNFINTEFSGGDVHFENTKFGTGKNSFKVAHFGKGSINFSHTLFCADDTSFEQTDFCDGDITFRGATFKDTKVNFISANFGDGEKLFIHTNFGDGDIRFKNACFANGKISFRQANFGDGIVDFHFCEFGKGDVIFDSAKFSNGGLNFRAVSFGTGKVSFKRSLLGNGSINFQGISLIGNFIIQDSVFGNGEVDFSEANLLKAKVLIQNVDFGIGKISFKDSSFDVLSLHGSQLDNYFDLRVKRCNIMDLSDTVVKDIIDLDSDRQSTVFKALNLNGMRLLGRIYIDWYKHNVKFLIESQDVSMSSKAEQFRILKENYNVTGQYNFEDQAYVAFKRAEAKAVVRLKIAHKPKLKYIFLLGKFWDWLIFDKMGKYATDPIRVLTTMIVTYIGFSLLFVFLGEFGDMHIASSLFKPGDPRIMSIFPKAFYHSAITFLTIGYGDYYPTGFTRWLSAFEGFVGLFQMSYFTVAFVRKMLR